MLNNLNVTLFAYHLCQDLSLKTDQLCKDADALWKWCAELGQINQIGVYELEKLPEKIKAYQKNRLFDNRYWELLGSKGWELQASTKYPLNLSVYPVQIHDVYVLDLTLEYPEKNLSSQDFEKLNPRQALLPNLVRASLGTSLLLYAEPLNSPDSDDHQISDSCVNSFFGTDKTTSLFVKQGCLLGGSIFEYDNLEVDPRKQIHILVWLNRNLDPHLIGNFKRPLINLLCCRSKVLFAYHSAKNDYNGAREVNSYLEQRTKEFPTLAQSTKRLKEFKQMLEEIPPQSFACELRLRSLNNHLTTVEANAKNYTRWLAELQTRLLPGDELNFLADFSDRIEQTFLPQIQVNLNYLSPGQELYSQMVESIRGLVEIEEAESDRRLEETIQVVSVALGVGGLVASSSPSALQEKPINFFPQQQPFTVFPQIHPFIFSCLIILLSAGVAAFATYLLISVIRKK